MLNIASEKVAYSRPENLQIIQLTSRDWRNIGGVLLAAFLMRVWFLHPSVYYGDSIEYVRGALWTVVAHSPGYVGYCALARLLNSIVGNIQWSFVIISFASTLAAICLTYLLAAAMGFDRRGQVLAAAAYAISFVAAFNSIVITSYPVEGMFVALIGCLGWLAIKKQSWSLALATTLAWAAGGAIRPSTTMFLFPLWLYIVFRSNRRIAILAAHGLIAAPIILAWSYANNYYSSAMAGFEPPAMSSFEQQALMAGGYEAATFSVETERNPATLAYHWPGAEVVAWLENHSGIHLLRRNVEWPAPSLSHAVKLTAINVGKCSYFLLISLPLLLAAPLLWMHRNNGIFPPGSLLFGAIWIAGPMCFFTFAHFGSPGYILILLPILCVLMGGAAARLLSLPDSNWPLRLTLAGALTASLMMGLVWCFGKPLSHQHLAANLLLLQYTGTAATEQFAINRLGIALSDGKEHSDPYHGLRTDAELLAQMHKNGVIKAPSPIQ